MKLIFKAALVAFALAAVSACSSVTIDEYDDNKPLLVPEKFFDGQLSACQGPRRAGDSLLQR